MNNKFQDGYGVGIWFISLFTLPVSLAIMGINWYTGYMGILASGYVDFAGVYAGFFAGLIGLTVITNNLTLGYRLTEVWDSTNEDGFFDALRVNKSMRYLSFILCISYLADTATQVWAVIGNDYDVLNVITSTIFSLFVFTVLAEVMFSTSVGILFANWQYVKPLLMPIVSNKPVATTQNNVQSGQKQQGNQRNQTMPLPDFTSTQVPPQFPTNPQRDNRK